MIFFAIFKFILVLILLFFLPGYLILEILFKKSQKITYIEKIILSLPISIGIIDFLVIYLSKLNISLNPFNLFVSFSFFIIVLFALNLFLNKKFSKKVKYKEFLKKIEIKNLIILSLISFFIGAKFLVLDIVPNNTDLGHHMYWVKDFLINENIPKYDTSDVIIGEHIGFFVISSLTGIDILSAFPVVFLMLINVVSFLIVYFLIRRITKNPSISLITYAFIAVLYVISSPMMKYVSGGVVGNIMGNLFIPSILLFLFLAFKHKKGNFLALSIFLSISLFYIHHLSTFLLAFILLFLFLFQIILEFVFPLHKRFSFEIIKKWIKILFKPLPLLTLIFFALTVFTIYTPHYVRHDAYETVVKTPEKDSHLGVSYNSFTSSIGELRTMFGLLGLALLIYFTVKKSRFNPKNSKALKTNLNINIATAIFIGWVTVLMILSFFPQILKVDLPSRRVVNYLVIPFSFLSAYFIFYFFTFIYKKLNKNLSISIILTISLAIFLNGYSDSITYYRFDNQFQETVNLYHASQYLADKSDKDDVILKDHANLTADTWIKNFLMRGYNYVLSRTFDYKYEDNKNREQCTFLMATQPLTEKGEECFSKTNTDFVILRRDEANYFFDNSDKFDKVYESDAVVIYYRN